MSLWYCLKAFGGTFFFEKLETSVSTRLVRKPYPTLLSALGILIFHISVSLEEKKMNIPCSRVVHSPYNRRCAESTEPCSEMYGYRMKADNGE